MIDFHNHILPNVDDGSTSMEMTLDMMNHAVEQGITDVVNTVHYQHPKVDGLDISYNRINKITNNLQYELDKNSIPINIHIGSEVFFYPNLTKILDDQLATIGNGKYMLIEFLPNIMPVNQKNTLFNLKMLGVTPIIAHPERYKPVQKDINLVYEWLSAGCLIQIDAGSLLGRFGKTATAISQKIIMRNWCQILGSDAHDNKRRNFLLKDAYELTKNMIGEDAKPLVYDNPMAVINGKSIIIEPEENKIEKGNSFWDKFMFKKKK